MNVIEKATKHYESSEKLVISVPEWGDENAPLLIHVFPMTMAEMNLIQRITRKNAGNMEHAVNLIIVKAKDENGNRLFKLDDKDILMKKADYRVVARIAEEIESQFFTDVETQKGNSEETPSDTSS
nr:hypothetical protein 7 [bacterium]